MIFGYPVAQENDAEHAVRAALAMYAPTRSRHSSAFPLSGHDAHWFVSPSSTLQ